jgi:hypothetical protein
MALLVILARYELYVLGLYKNESGQLTVDLKKGYTGIQLGLTHGLTPVLVDQCTLSATAEPCPQTYAGQGSDSPDQQAEVHPFPKERQ